ncbi:MAG: hypothetical protein HOV78_11830 [Hamadaea sp.]|nr:hypothetical protein [Hamadaea sp.]
MTQPPPEPPIRPEFGVPPMRPVAPTAFQDPVDRKRRMVLGIIGAVVGVGIPVIIVIIGIVLSLTSSGTGPERWFGLSFVVLAGLAIAGPLQLIAGIVFAVVDKTRPFGVGFLIGSAIGMIILAGACFAPFVGLQ